MNLNLPSRCILKETALSMQESVPTQIDQFYQRMLKQKARLGSITFPKEKKSFILTPERDIAPVEPSELQTNLIKRANARTSPKYFKTILEKSKEVAPKEFLETLGFCRSLGLFYPYHSKSNSEFGYLASREIGKILITSRGSSKKQNTKISSVTQVDVEAGKIHAKGRNKPSLNCYTATKIFSQLPWEYKWIVHTHIDLEDLAHHICPEAQPGSVSDYQSIPDNIQTPEDQSPFILSQQHHGGFIAFTDPEDLKKLFLETNCYNARPHHYEGSYVRFQNHSALETKILDTIPKYAKILDLAGGTGLLCQTLDLKKYTNLYLADKSEQMLEIASGKGIVPKTKIFKHILGTSIPIPYGPFDAVIIRQAINYLGEKELQTALETIFQCLTPGGYLIFNTFDPKKINLQERHTNRKNGFLHEFNTLILNEAGWNEILHAQALQNVYTGEVIHDLNQFYCIPLEFLKNSLEKFESKLETENSSVLVTARKP